MKKIFLLFTILVICSIMPVIARNSIEKTPVAPATEIWRWTFNVKQLYPMPNQGQAVKVKLDLLALDADLQKHDIRVYSAILNSYGIGPLKDHGIISQGKDRVIEVVPAGYYSGFYTIVIEGDCPTLGKNVKVKKRVFLSN